MHHQYSYTLSASRKFITLLLVPGAAVQLQWQNHQFSKYVNSDFNNSCVYVLTLECVTEIFRFLINQGLCLLAYYFFNIMGEQLLILNLYQSKSVTELTLNYYQLTANNSQLPSHNIQTLTIDPASFNVSRTCKHTNPSLYCSLFSSHMLWNFCR